MPQPRGSRVGAAQRSGQRAGKQRRCVARRGAHPQNTPHTPHLKIARPRTAGSSGGGAAVANGHSQTREHRGTAGRGHDLHGGKTCTGDGATGDAPRWPQGVRARLCPHHAGAWGRGGTQETLRWCHRAQAQGRTWWGRWRWAYSGRWYTLRVVRYTLRGTSSRAARYAGARGVPYSIGVAYS